MANRYSFKAMITGSINADTKEEAQEAVMVGMGEAVKIITPVIDGQINVEAEVYPEFEEDAGQGAEGSAQSILERIDKGFDAVTERLQKVGMEIAQSNAEVAGRLHEIVGGLREMTGANVLQRNPDMGSVGSRVLEPIPSSTDPEPDHSIPEDGGLPPEEDPQEDEVPPSPPAPSARRPGRPGRRPK